MKRRIYPTILILLVALLSSSFNAMALIISDPSQAMSSAVNKEIMNIVIGQPYDAKTGSFKNTSVLFVGKLMKKGDITFDQIDNQAMVMAAGNSTNTQNAWGLTGSETLNVRAPFTRVNVKLNHAISKNTSTMWGGQVLQAIQKSTATSYINDDLIDYRQANAAKVGEAEKTLYSCATDVFQGAINNIRKAKNIAGLVKALEDFESNYGTHCVITVNLTQMAIAEAVSTFSGDSETDTLDLGGSVSASAGFAKMGTQAQIAEQYTSKNFNEQRAGQFSVIKIKAPGGDWTDAWIEDITEKFTDTSLSDMAGKASEFQTAFSPKEPDTPEMPTNEAEEPDIIDLPDSDSPEDMSKAYQKMAFTKWQKAYYAKHGKEPDEQDYLDYQDQLKVAQKKLADNRKEQGDDKNEAIIHIQSDFIINDKYFN